MLFSELNYIQLNFGANPFINYEIIGQNVILYNLIHRIRIQIRIILVMLQCQAFVKGNAVLLSPAISSQSWQGYKSVQNLTRPKD